MTYLYKLITNPILPIEGTWLDAGFFLMVFALLALAALFFYFSRKSEWLRLWLRVAASFVFVVLVFFCVCLLRTSIHGLSQIGWDDYIAFANLFLFVMIAAFTLVFGRIFCGWICPFGFFQELVHKISPLKRKRIKLIFLGCVFLASLIFLYRLKPATDFFAENVIGFWAIGLLIIVMVAVIKPEFKSYLRRIRYISLSLYVLASGLFVFFSEAWCPIYGGEIDYASTLAFFIILLASLVISMSWCRYLCPTGTLLSLISRFSLFKIKPKHNISDSKVRDQICPVGSLEKDSIDESTCLCCGRCLAKCGNELGSR